jgi:hypothetical protein
LKTFLRSAHGNKLKKNIVLPGVIEQLRCMESNLQVMISGYDALKGRFGVPISSALIVMKSHEPPSIDILLLLRTKFAEFSSNHGKERGIFLCLPHLEHSTFPFWLIMLFDLASANGRSNAVVNYDRRREDGYVAYKIVDGPVHWDMCEGEHIITIENIGGFRGVDFELLYSILLRETITAFRLSELVYTQLPNICAALILMESFFTDGRYLASGMKEINTYLRVCEFFKTLLSMRTCPHGSYFVYSNDIFPIIAVCFGVWPNESTDSNLIRTIFTREDFQAHLESIAPGLRMNPKQTHTLTNGIYDLNWNLRMIAAYCKGLSDGQRRQLRMRGAVGGH